MHQEQEMSVLNTTVENDKKEIHFLKNRGAHNENSAINTIPDKHHLLFFIRFYY